MDGSCSGQPNTNPPWTGQPVLKTKTANGSLWMAGQGEDQIYGELLVILPMDELIINLALQYPVI